MIHASKKPRGDGEEVQEAARVDGEEEGEEEESVH
jgi:hypothetical protein